MTYTYVASTNTLKQVPTMERPVAPNPELYGGDSRALSQDVHDFMIEKEEYNAHLASLKEIPCEPGCKEVWKDGQEVVDEKDFEVQAICNGQRYDCRKVDRCGYCKLLAVAIKAESEDEDAMLDDIQLLLNCFERKAGRNAVKQKYTISKKK
jgi:hypothetical protein